MESKSQKICNSPLQNECSNFGVFEYYLCNECKAELDCFHDAIFNANGLDLNYEQLSEEFIKLPTILKELSIKWGVCNTVFRDKVYELYKLKSD